MIARSLAWVCFCLTIASFGCASGEETTDQLVDATAGDTTIEDETSTTDGSAFDLGMTGCVKKTCAELGINCGPAADGCGGLVDCGTCTPPEICGGGGKPSVCGTAPCTKKTCAELGAKCGMQGDGCGGLIDCGACVAPETCGGGGVPNTCGAPPKPDTGPPCVPKTCASFGYNCGPTADGCGGLIDCGKCTTGICGGGGTPNVCGGGISSGCVKKTCADRGANCGPVSDGCGGLTTSCGTCTAPQTCGGGGVPSVCGGGPPPCTKKTCADFPLGTCGPMPDGCGGLTTSCGSCTPPDTCGGGGVPSKCGGAPPPCVKKTCADYPGTCGQLSDGCGGLTANCGACVSPQTCGGGGVPSVCGGGPPPCVKKTCADYPSGTCGQMSDGCGGLTTSCGTCTAPATCGGGGVASVCGGATACTKKTCADYPSGTCGQVSDGCGGLTANCGSCTSPQTCGGGGVASMCGGGPPPCTKKTCADYPSGTCGQVSDGCGGLTVSCGTCTAPNTCGGGGVASQCGGAPPPCTKKTCADYPSGTCGQVSDGCGGLTANCGSCTSPAICGGGGVASQCGGGGGSTCVNLECKQVTCIAGLTSSISGIVYDPAGNNPLYNVFVYIPNGTPTAFVSGATCDKCADALSGYPLVQTVSNEKGEFKLDNVPVGTDIPLVIQTGKWRRQVKITTRACIDTPIVKDLTRLPRTKAEGDIPKIALSTGGFDTLECLLRKVGIADSEFTNPTGTGRVNLYKGQPATGSTAAAGKYDAALGGANFPDSTTLWASLSSLQKYDVTLLGCEGNTFTATKTAANLRAMYDYVNIGGRVFASHYHHYWVSSNTNGTGTGAWSTLATWIYPSPGMYYKYPSNPYYLYIPEKIVTTFPKGMSMASWLLNIGGSGVYPAGSGYPSGLGTLTVYDGKNSVKSYDSARVTEWIYSLDTQLSSTLASIPRATQYMSFNAPVGATSTSQCGRFVFSDIHVSSGDRGTAFPSECKSTGMSPQEKALEFMLFDLSSRVCDDKLTAPPPTCTKRTCADQGIECGSASDGCGGTITSCGTCASPLVCSTGGKCAGSSCVPKTCSSLGLDCGMASDGCGGALNCGTCTAPATCGGGGIPGKCGGSACAPTTCTALGLSCGSAPDGCGGTLNCGTCVAPQTCGGGGITGKCGGGCTPTTCAALGQDCGSAADGCGATLTCGSCVSPETCGGGGIPGKCGGTGCKPTTCAELGLSCGAAADGCGGVLTCGTCASPMTCGGGGVAGKCGGGSCTPTTCSALGIECGSAANGCGGVLSCGTCVAPKTCGGGGVPGKCGGSACTPTTCSALGIECGPAADGCGGTLSCGTCTAPSTCGGGGTLGKCGKSTCVKKTCAEMGVSCGPSGDGCGGTIDCGPCPTTDAGVPSCTPLTCGGRCGPQGDGCGGILMCPACPGSGCVPTTCTAAGAQCGAYPDGCGGLLDCGTCVAPSTCGGGGVAFKCGGIK